MFVMVTDSLISLNINFDDYGKKSFAHLANEIKRNTGLSPSPTLICCIFTKNKWLLKSNFLETAKFKTNAKNITFHCNQSGWLHCKT